MNYVPCIIFMFAGSIIGVTSILCVEVITTRGRIASHITRHGCMAIFMNTLIAIGMILVAVNI